MLFQGPSLRPCPIILPRFYGFSRQVSELLGRTDQSGLSKTNDEEQVDNDVLSDPLHLEVNPHFIDHFLVPRK